MFLNAEEIKKEIKITPFREENLDVESYDLTLSNSFSKNGITYYKDDMLVLKPKQFILGMTEEKLQLPLNIMGILATRSSWARRGLSVHASAGFVHAGFKGRLVLELFNFSDKTLVLYPKETVAQIIFLRGSQTTGYKGQYLNQ